MKLSTWCKSIGISYRAGWNQYKAGKIKEAFQLSTGTIIVPDLETTQENNKQSNVIVYARVSSSENKKNLDSQAKRLVDFCNTQGLQVNSIIKETASGLNEKRPKLNKILQEGKATHLVVEHKDRLSRFGVEYIKILCKHIKCKLIIVNNVEDEKENLMEDFVSLVTSFCARIYGNRRSKRNTEKLILSLKEEK